MIDRNPSASELLEATPEWEASRPYFGQWRRLVSTTNWEKGRIIAEWREALQSSGAPASVFSDDTWAKQVGGITGQHVGRLRRVHERFGEVKEGYSALYWSHFLAAIDWNDAEMWLEGALQNRWSVSHMRKQREETLSGLATLSNDGPVDTTDSLAAINSDIVEMSDEGAEDESGEFSETTIEDAPFDDVGAEPVEHRASDLEASNDRATISGSRSSPLIAMSRLPDDLLDAVESLKLAILSHKATHWSDVSPDDVRSVLEGLAAIIDAPTDSASG